MPAASAAGAPSAAAQRLRKPDRRRQAEFIAQARRRRARREAQTGIPAAFMVAQAAHESGWGKHEIRNADGSTSHNLFGIKAGANWKGAVDRRSRPPRYVDGEARKVQAKFRAYGSYDESFRDYAQLMKDSPRYAQVVELGHGAHGFAQGLQRAGYATDPAYADKLTRVINTTLRVQRACAQVSGESRMSGSALMSIGKTALFANYAALQTAGNNIANANTTGYSRQEAQLQTAQGQFTGSGFFGKGVSVATVTRAYSQLLTQQAVASQSIAAARLGPQRPAGAARERVPDRHCRPRLRRPASSSTRSSTCRTNRPRRLGAPGRAERRRRTWRRAFAPPAIS